MTQQNGSDCDGKNVSDTPIAPNVQNNAIDEGSEDAIKKGDDKKVGVSTGELRNEIEQNQVRGEDIDDGGLLCL